jgi:hypothetical protein
MKQLYIDSIDWLSIKLNAICLVGFFTGSSAIAILTIIATLTTIVYNSIRIYKEVKNNKKQ